MTLNKLEYSPQGYRLLRNTGHLILPSYSTVRRLTLSQNLSPAAEQQENNFLVYIKNKFKFLSESDTTVILMVDEIHIKQYFDYKGGNVVGSAFNSTEAASSAFVFMISSVLSKFKDVVHILPAKTMKAEMLYAFIKRVIIGLEEIGFRVICIVTNNNAINRKAMTHFHSPPLCSTVYRHPAQASRPLFFMYDSVHLFKCIRNNWLNQKNADKCMIFPQFSFEDVVCDSVTRVCKAPFTTLKKLHSIEAESLLKHGYRLTLKSLSPSNIERQNVSLVSRIFNEYIVEALKTLGEMHSLPYFEDIANYIQIIYVWWTIMIVKSPCKDRNQRNKYAAPLTKDENSESYFFLHNFLNWLDVWDSMKQVTGKLTLETFAALKQCLGDIGTLQAGIITYQFGKYLNVR